MKTGLTISPNRDRWCHGGKNIENNRQYYFKRQFAGNFCDILAHHYQIL